MDETLLQVTNLRVSYHTYAGEVQSVRGVSFDVKKGETVAVVGESGCGKSVTAKSIMHLIKTPPAEYKPGSEILFDGENVLDFDEKRLRQYRGGEAAIIFQDALASLNPTMTVGNQIIENILHHKKVSKKEALAQAVELLRMVGIPEPEKRVKQYPHEFSGGMRQRVMIAIAFACDPKLLIADEPTTALDVTIQAQIIDLIKDLQAKKGASVILITHDLGVVANIADRVAVMYAGDIVEIGTADDVYYDPRHPYTWALLSSMPQMGIKGEDLFNIQGTPPNLFVEIRGDAFAPRNPQALKIDFVKRPPYFEVSPTHKAKTWLLDPRAPKVEPPAVVRMLREGRL
jgi:oligopeptide/dipeptide ABC transporter ATP-binding protein